MTDEQLKEIFKKHCSVIAVDGKIWEDIIPAMKEAVEKGSIAFKEWACEEGWEWYDGSDRWICPSNGKRVVTTKQLYHQYIKSLNP